ncbi:MAG: rhodanese-like domain-containing protein [Mariprofundaceae bacterium]|nr:rhodanese-like domain-containing protein [Mariprofundaceae bacterium]
MKQTMKYVWLLWLLLVIPMSVTACSGDQMSADGYENSSVSHAYAHWKQGDKSSIPFVFLDVRTQQEYEAGHVPGALHIPVASLQNRLSEIPKGKRIYVYCEAGVRAAKASKMLVRSGFSNIENLPESMGGWRRAGYPIE